MGKGQRIKAERAQEREASIKAAQGSSSKSLPMFWIIVGGILAIGAVTLLISSATGSKSSDTKKVAQAKVFSKITTSGAALPDFTDGSTDTAVGKVAPVISGKDGTGAPMSIGGPSDKPTMVLFVAHWCPHCQAEIPKLSKHLAKHGMPDGINVVTVATASSDSRPNYPPLAWLKRENWTPPVLLDDQLSSALNAYGAGGFPYFVALDKNGKVVVRKSGEISEQEFDAIVKQLNPAA